ncbi:PREDICTED: uncharacterized protein LOC108567202 [Nicrophorus vespilloides]|uniref:Uncharacterized protein LOC108567202 n=1 Tax=Nicrophorus vespilloides TaxID=110193 RepID=A0ABM1N872_NICVS|nr:PREDICTED: uncharacterized protein LOC108567202 [Nicrophorus vespilloides]
MKATVTVFIILVAFASAGKIHYAEKYLDQIATSRTECFKKEGVDLKYLEQVDDSETIPTFDQQKCYVLCMINKFKFTDAELRFQAESYKEYFDDLVLWEKVETALSTKCLPKDKKIRSCEDAYDMYICLVRNV